MKKIFALVTIFFMVLSAIFADEYVVSKIECMAADGFYDRELTLKYDDSDNVYYLCRSNYSAVYWFILTPTKLEKLRANLKKVQDWIKLAKENKSSISKELPDSKISVEGVMKRGNDWYSTRWNIDLNFYFVSQITEEAEVMSILLRGGEVESRQNQFVDIGFESLVFINNEIDAFINAISEQTIEAAKKQHEQEKSAADMFN